MIKNNNALCICMSPLQAFLLVNIIKVFCLDATVLFLTPFSNDRTNHYLNALKQVSSNVLLIEVAEKPVWAVLCEIEFLLLRCANIDSIFIASFNSFYPAYVANRLRVANLNVFDDGSFSICNKKDRELYYGSLPGSLAAKALFALLNINQINDNLLLRACYLYTIYPLHQQLVPPKKVVEFKFASLESVEIFSSPLFKVLNIFIGDVPKELSGDQLSLYKKVISNKLIHYYIRHPRNNLCSLGKEKLISIHIIVEEFIIKMLRAGHHVNALSFTSTTLFNLPKLPNLNKFMLRQPHFSLPSLVELAPEFDIMIIDESEISALLQDD